MCCTALRVLLPQRCYCTICVKGNGSSGAGVNLGGDRASLKVQGEENVAKYHPRISERGAAEKKVIVAWVRDETGGRGGGSERLLVHLLAGVRTLSIHQLFTLL